jgi:hypothetical protein
MREYPYIIREHLVNGLAPDNHGTKNSKHLETLKNLRCVPQGATALETVTQVPWTTGLTPAWPFPQLCSEEDVNIVLGGSAASWAILGTWSGDATPAVTTGIYQPATPVNQFVPGFVTGVPYQFAAMRDLWIATNGTYLLWKFPFGDGKVVGAALPCLSVAQHSHRLLLGGLSGSWFTESTNARWKAIMDAWRRTQPKELLIHEDTAFTNNWVVWSERGGGAKDVPYHLVMVMLGAYGTAAVDTAAEEIVARIESGEIGMVNPRGAGRVKAMVPMGDTVIVYGHHGVCALTPDQGGARYLERMVHHEGLSVGSAVAAGRDAHVAILDTGDLAVVDGQGVKVVGFGHLFTGRNMSVNYDPNRTEWWIADADGGYVWNGSALSGPHDVRPSGLVRRGGKLWGTSTTIPSVLSVEVKTVPFDLGERGSKHVTEVYSESEGISAMSARVDWRTSSEALFQSGPSAPMNPQGVAFPRTSFVDGKVVVTGSATGTVPSITAIGVRFHDEDKRFRRGPKGSVASSDEPGDA